ncbi:MAG: hypothetical protein E6J70_09780 [Deltaproteobacteria bacterium]|nr:MAG: hypothetical protein E6J70_09780 [Deltaproteobacteria bacterium]
MKRMPFLARVEIFEEAVSEDPCRDRVRLVPERQVWVAAERRRLRLVRIGLLEEIEDTDRWLRAAWLLGHRRLRAADETMEAGVASNHAAPTADGARRPEGYSNAQRAGNPRAGYRAVQR